MRLNARAFFLNARIFLLTEPRQVYCSLHWAFWRLFGLAIVYSVYFIQCVCAYYTVSTTAGLQDCGTTGYSVHSVDFQYALTKRLLNT